MHAPRRRIRVQARPALAWTLFFFLVGHVVVGAYLCRLHPEWSDLEFSLRLHHLRERLTENPQRPLALAVGSSRFVLGLRPESVMQAAGREPQPLLFNLSMLGVGPVGERMLLRRVLSKGIQPRWLFVEVWAPFLRQKDFSDEESILFRRDLYWSDLPIVSRLYHRTWDAAERVIAESLTPLLHYRVGVLNRYAPNLLPSTLIGDRKFSEELKSHLDAFGWVAFESASFDPAELHTHQERAKLITKPLFDDFQVSDVSDRAMRELLDECRANDIRVAFVLMPEHSLVRSWYPSMQGPLTAYLRGLSDTYCAPIIDARAWHADADIPDCCHLSPKGARAFSERFGREVYGPLLHGRALSRTVLLE